MPEPLDAQQRRRRRELLRQHHPDLGGDPETFHRVVMAFEADAEQPGAGPAAGDSLTFVRRPRGLGRLAAWYVARRDRSARPRRVV